MASLELRSHFLVVLLMISLVRCIVPAQAKDSSNDGTTDHPIKIGLMMTLTGLGAKVSKEVVRGFTLYFDSVGKSAAGRPVDIIIEDDKNSPEVALLKINELVKRDKVDLFAGFRYTPIAYAVENKIDSEWKIPFLILMSSGDALTQTKHPHWLLRTEWASSQAMFPLGDFAYKHLGLRRMATIGVHNVWGFEGIGAFQQSFENLGGKIVQKIWVPRDATDVRAELSHLHRDIDGICQITDETTSQLVVQELKRLGNKATVVAQGGVTDIDPSSGKYLLGYVTFQPYFARSANSANKIFRQRYKAKYGKSPRYFAELGYTSAMIVHEAIVKCNGHVENRSEFLRALLATQIDAPSGHKSFDSYGQLVQDINIRRMEKTDGTIKNKLIYIYPHVSQFWTFDPAKFMAQPPYSENYPPCKWCE